jgi:predicted permease
MNLHLYTLLRRLRRQLRRNAVIDEISEELRFHVEARATDLERRGLSREDAARQARLRFGNMARIQDEGYDVRGGGFLETVWQDVRYAVRLLRRQPAFATVAIGTFSLGIGATAALFSVMDAALIRPLPFPKPEQLVDVRIRLATPTGTRSGQGASLTDARIWKSLPVIANVALWSPSPGLIADVGEPERVTGLQVSEGYFELFGIRPVLGQSFTEEMTRPESPAVGVLGHSYWRRRFGGEASVIGRSLRLGRQSVTIIGVLPEGFEHEIDVWLPFRWDPALRGFSAAYARLHDGVTLEQAQRDWTARMGEVRPWPDGSSIQLTPLLDDVSRGSRAVVKTLAAGVALILLIACLNVAGLLLARGSTRGAELAVRSSLGAGRVRLVRQLITESAVLAVAGAMCGLFLAWFFLDAIVGLLPLELPASSIPTLNGLVVGLTILTAAVTAIIAGIVPARRLSNSAGLLQAGSRDGREPLTRRTGQVLIAAEFALAVVLVTGAGLLLRSLDRLLAVDLGFDPESVMVMRASPLQRNPEAFRDFYATLLEKVRHVPGVEAAGAIDFVPLGGSSTNLRIESASAAAEDVDSQYVLPGYFESLSMTPREGRVFGPGTGDLSSVVLDEHASRILFPGGGAVGQRVTIQKTAYEVVGVVPHVKRWGGLPETTRPNVYRLVPAGHTGSLAVTVRTMRNVRIPPNALRAVAHESGSSVLVDSVAPGADLLAHNTAVPRRRTILLAILGGLGLVLTLVGIASVTAYTVARRTREIGVRLAFGADPGAVVWTMMRDAIWPATIGLAIGLGTSYFAMRLVASFLFQTEPHDALTFAAAATLILIAAGLAAWLPARRAAHVDPVLTLRSE